MRLNNEMNKVRREVDRRTMRGLTYKNGNGNFMMNGMTISRNVLENSSSNEVRKFLLCGTCGILMSSSEIETCERCDQYHPNHDSFMGQISADWMRRKVTIQKDRDRDRKFVPKIVDYTDDTSTVTTAGESAANDWDRQYNDTKLSRSIREKPTGTKMAYPGDPDEKFYKFLSGFGMQEPWEKIYSQGERLWLPSRAGTARTHTIANETVKLVKKINIDDKQIQIGGTPSKKSQSLRRFGGAMYQDKPHTVDRGRNPTSLKVPLRREPSLR